MNSEQFKDAIRSTGLVPPDHIVPGVLYRFPGLDKSKSNTAGRCKMFNDGVGGWFKDLASGIEGNWQAARKASYSQAEREAFMRQLAEDRRVNEAEEAAKHEEVAIQAAEIVNKSTPAPAEHPYLVEKRIKAHGVRLSSGPLYPDALVIPGRDAAGKSWTAQFIKDSGDKRFLKDGKTTGCYFAIGSPKGATAFCVAEGFATAATVHEATGHPVAVAFTANNLGAVTQIMRSKFPDLPIIVCGDDDYLTPGNPGVTKATAAARAVNGRLALPSFGPDRGEKDTDFNDMARLSGLDAVRQIISEAKPITDAEPQAETVEPPQSAKACTSEAIGNDCHRNTPKPDPAMLYGLIGDIAEAGAKDSEANKFAVAASFMTFLSAAVGRYVALPIGDDVHHARLFMLHVGRSSKGRKGTATALTKKIIAAIEKKHEKTSGSYAAPFCGNVHTGGLSTREGLALLIHDGIKQGKEDIPPITDKRLFVIESEFSNVLHQGKRDGNTLSGALRDGWDGLSIKPATKSAKVWATDPHIAVYANITPSELTGLMDSRELTNGFANRFLMFWAERSRIEPDPLPVPPNLVDSLSDRTMAVIKFAKGDYPATQDGATAYMTDGARVLFSKIYREELTANFDGDKISAIIERRAPMLKRIALLFALTDLTRAIEEKHVIAALAWVRYHRDSVLFIFNNSIAEEAIKESGDASIKILDYLRTHGETSRSALYKKCFSGHLSSGSLDAAIDSLLMTSPPSIEVFKSELLENGKHQKFYKCCVLGVFGVVPQPVRDCANTQPCVLGVLGAILENPSTPSTPSTQTSTTLANRPSTPNTPNTQPQHRNKNLADSEKTPDILIEYSDSEVEVEI